MNEAERLDRVTGATIGAAMGMHRALGPGLLESAYEACLAFDLAERGLSVRRQVPLPIAYQGVNLDCAYRLDLLVEDAVIVEVKAVDRLLPIHKAQMLSYLKLSGRTVGLLANFNVQVLRNGVCRVVNDFPDSRRSPRPRR